MAAQWQAYPEDIPTQSLCPVSTVITVTDMSEYDSVLCPCAELPLTNPHKRGELERCLIGVC